MQFDYLKCLLILCAISMANVAFAQKENDEKQSGPKPDPNYPLDLKALGIRLPMIADRVMSDKLNDPRTVFYKLPQVYQHFIPGSRVEHRNLTLGTITYTTTNPTWGIYFTSYLQTFNANKDFPWEGTIGLNHAIKESGEDIYKTINFLYLPKDSKGETKPVLLLNEIPNKWIFPPGATVGEIIMVKNGDRWWIQEIRSRTKGEKSFEWEPQIHRPVRDRAELYRYLGLPADTEPAKKYMFFRNPEEDEVFKMEGYVERLPELSERQTMELLSRSFKDVTYDYWSKISTAPSSDQDFSILPKDYSLGLIDVDAVSCASCHKQTQISVRNLIPKEPLIIKNPQSVGNIRGSDGIFTWYPWDRGSVALNKEENSKKLYLRKHDLDNGFVKVWDDDLKGSTASSRLYWTGEPPEDYKITSYVQDALKNYELPSNSIFLHQPSESKPAPTSGLPSAVEKAAPSYDGGVEK